MTDAQVERALAAYDAAYWGARENFPASVSAGSLVDEQCKRVAMRAAIAAMPDAAPLEDVLRANGVYNIEIDYGVGGGWDVLVCANGLGNGSGPTIDAAIRAAVANAQEGDDAN